jgi:SAM-dependent methyltransferase
MSAVSQGFIRGPAVLDLGCGVGDNALYLAKRGFSVTGIDISTAAIAMAKRKAHKLSVDARFVTLDAFQLGTLTTKFETLIDFGLFHQFAGATRTRYVRSLSDVCTNRGQLLLQCFRDKGGIAHWFGPNLVSQEDLRASFAVGWQIEWIRPASFRSNKGRDYPAWLAFMTYPNSE